MNELIDAFGQIEEITDYLKITHSFPITSLGFFKKLGVIRGEKLDVNNASLVVLDNPNLSDLFPEGRQMEIQKGRLFFHYNPKLCLSKIQTLGKMVGITNFTDLEVQPESNGDKVACNVVNINIKVVELGPDHALLAWDAYKPTQGQQLLSYLLNYIEADKENMTFETNSCGGNSWQVVDVGIPSWKSSTKSVTKLIVDLQPYTKYVVYVKTFTSRKDHVLGGSPVGQSEIISFMTLSDTPSVPTGVKTHATSDRELMVKWSPPEEPNGPIKYYSIAAYLREEDHWLIERRDYCKDELISETDYDEDMFDFADKLPAASTQDEKNCCSKVAKPKRTKHGRKIEFFCHDNNTFLHQSQGRRRNYYCSTPMYSYLEDLFPSLSYRSRDTTPVGPQSNEFLTKSEVYVFNGNVSANSSWQAITNLKHYSFYTILLSACGNKFDNGTELCSPQLYRHVRTKSRIEADDVQGLKVDVLNDTIVIVSWDPVGDPNGLTLAYNIEYTNLNVKDVKKTVECVPATRDRYKRGAHYINHLNPGKYSLRVRSVSLAGKGNPSSAVTFSIGLKEDRFNLIVGILFFLCSLAGAGMLAAYVVMRRRQERRKLQQLFASVNPDYIETKYVMDSWEVQRENVQILEELGLGNFGMVYRGIMSPGAVQVALKTISESASEIEKNEFLNEASVMKNFSTFHIIKLLGVVSAGAPPYVIMELMENGDLKTYLRKIRDTHLVPNATKMVRMAAEIADGMAYLESKKFVHRDLAARNCMVSKDLVCKIGDFGMARDIYETDYYKIGKKGLLPIRWMAPENLSDGVFTSDSDVWSFGVVLYEILTLAEIPYQGLSNEEVLNYVLRKGLLNVPRTCPENILSIIEKCFKWRPSERPTFMEIVAELEPFLGQDFCEKSFYHSEEGVEIRSLGIKKVYHHAAPIRFHWGTETARWVKDFEDNVTLLDQTKAGTSRGRIFKNSLQQLASTSKEAEEEIPLEREGQS